MADDGTAFAAIAETTSFLNYFSDLPDYRQAGKVDYPLPEVLLLILLAVLAGAEAFTDIAQFGEKKLDLLRRFLPFANGTPAHDHLGDIFTNQLLTCAQQVAHLLRLRIRHEARPDQTVRQQFGQPHRIVDVGLAARHVLHMRGAC